MQSSSSARKGATVDWHLSDGLAIQVLSDAARSLREVKVRWDLISGSQPVHRYEE
jgi:hypothetical protein